MTPREDLPWWVLDVPLAHRGLWGGDVPENSLAAFAAARDAGVGVELDVHVTADGHVVVHHDTSLHRLTGVDLDVRRARLGEVREHALPDGSPVPTLVEVLDVLGDAPVMVELKNLRRGVGDVEPATAAVLERHGRRAYVASFHPGSLAWFARHHPWVLRAQTAGVVGDERVPAPVRAVLRRLGFARWARPHLVSFQVEGLPSPPTTTWRRRGGAVVAWTVRDEQALAAAAAHADNVVFEGLAPPAWPPAAT